MIKKQELGTWKTFRDNMSYFCNVPCSYYDVLITNGLVEDPYILDQVKTIPSLYGDDCRFETEFDVGEEILAASKQELVFEGLDTLCEIYLNGVFLGKADNMHRTWRFDVKDKLRAGSNTAVLMFSSAVTYMTEQQRRYKVRGNGNGEPTIAGHAHLRKAFYMSGWDWTHALPDMGIWRPAYILAYDARITDTQIRQKHLADGSVELICCAEIDGEGDLRTEFVVTDESGKEYRGVMGRHGECSIRIDDPKLWWPNGYGDQPLYALTVRLWQGEREIDCVTKQIGLRTLTVSRQKDVWGEEFCFAINGEKIFAKGANYIPEEMLLPRRSREKTELLIRRCAEAHMNVLRVWGGGFYPDDWFFDACDRYGIIVWQDCMFACNLIRLTEAMRENIRAELTDNIKRFRHHACLGLICGNNENEEMLVHWGTPLEKEALEREIAQLNEEFSAETDEEKRKAIGRKIMDCVRKANQLKK